MRKEAKALEKKFQRVFDQSMKTKYLSYHEAEKLMECIAALEELATALTVETN